MKDNQSRYTYTKGEKDLNRALKMQEKELKELQRESASIESSISENERKIEDARTSLDDMMKKVEALRAEVLEKAKDAGLEVPAHLKNPVMHVERGGSYGEDQPLMADEKISRDDIPTWEEVMAKTDSMVPDEVILEDLLSAEEFQYCIDDVKRINDEFSRKTRLNSTDISFLILATALQTARWIIIQQVMGDLGETIDSSVRMSSKEGDARKKQDSHDFSEKHSDRENIKSEKDYPTWKDIVFGQYKRTDGGKSSGNCPYDAQQGGPPGFDDGGKGNHRVHTLGHDPILGWIFGTANIMTCTISLGKKFNFSTYRVQYPGGVFADRITMLKMFGEMFESIREDKFRLAAGLFAQYAHLESDYFTSRGLPIPLLEVFTKDLAGKLYSEQYDALCLAKDMARVGTQAAFSILINMTIGFIHGLFYNEAKHGNRDHYEVRTRKILLYSNSLSSIINLAYVGGNAAAGNWSEALKKLDLGGLLVTLWRLFSDIRFITRVKEEFMKSEMDKVTREALADLDSMFE